MNKVTAPLASGAYSWQMKPETFLTHRVEVVDGEPVKVFCRVKPSSVLPDTSIYTQDRPTCAKCARAFDKENAS